MSTLDAEATYSKTTESGVTRRQVLLTVAAGGITLAGTALGAEKLGSLKAAAAYEPELVKLKALLAMYEQLERVGLDGILLTAMNVVRSPFNTVKVGLGLVRGGIATAGDALKRFQGMLDTLHQGAGGAAAAVDDLMGKFHAAESVVTGVLGTAQPLTDSIQSFFNALLDKIPFGIGANIRRAAESLVTLIRAIPTTVQALTTQLLKPLSDTFFPATGTPAVQASLFDPISEKLLQPLDRFLGDVETLLNYWEKDFTAPVQAALDQRKQIREQIEEYRKRNQI
jgi:hypothetical protein